MAFTVPDFKGQVYAPGYFLAHEDCVRKTYEVSDSGVVADEFGGKHVKGGTPYPANDATCIGLLYEDVDVTGGAMPGSVVLKGVVYEDRLPVALAGAAKTALINAGFTFMTVPGVVRP